MKNILLKLVKTIGWKKVLLFVWEAVDEDLKAAAAKTENKIDDEVVKFVDVGIRELCK